VTPTKDNDPLNGVSTFDLVLINKHILGLEPLNSPYKMIAADANNSRSITTFDIVELRKLILGIYTELPNNTSWRFVDENYQFPNPVESVPGYLPGNVSVADLQASHLDDDFVAVKVGDVNGNVVTSSLTVWKTVPDGTAVVRRTRAPVKAGETFTVDFKATEKVKGYQFTLYFPNLEVVDVKAGRRHVDWATSVSSTTSTPDDFVRQRTGTGRVLGDLPRQSRRPTEQNAGRVEPDHEGRSVPQPAMTVNANADRPALQRSERLNDHGQASSCTRTNRTRGCTKHADRLLPARGIGSHADDLRRNGPHPVRSNGRLRQRHNAITLDARCEHHRVLYYKVETPNDSAVKKMIQTK
jgi:hypothetical protein